jgi:predicted PurR-regulated permease PerM
MSGRSSGGALPVVLSLAQFVSFGTTAVLAGLLMAAQTWVGNILEPRMIGRQLNLSPFVVLVALSVRSALWGLPGAILAIPTTSMLAIICAAFEPTRFVAVLLAGQPSTDAKVAPHPEAGGRAGCFRPQPVRAGSRSVALARCGPAVRCG